MSYLYFLVIPLFIETCFASAYSPIPEQHIVVVTLMHNCARVCLDTLKSIFDQDYNNYHLILIDDNSSDNTAAIAKNYINRRHMQQKVVFIQHTTRHDVLANHRLAVNLCNDYDIVMHVDGDGDMLAHTGVLSRINKAYTEHPQVWMSYGSCSAKSTRKRIFTKGLPLEVLRNRTVRKYEWLTSHLRTFRAWLFKKIKHEDFLYKGSYHFYTADRVFMYPMLEMAGEKHVYYVDDILYIYNDHPGDPINWTMYFELLDYINNKDPYQVLE